MLASIRQQLRSCCPEPFAFLFGPDTRTTTRGSARRKLDHLPTGRKFVSPRTSQPAEYRVVAINPPLESESSVPSLLPSPPTSFPTDRAYVLELELTQPAQLDPKFGSDPDHITVKVNPISPTCLSVEIGPRDKQAWRVPEHVVVRHAPSSGTGSETTTPTLSEYEFVWDNPDQFGFKVRHRATGETIFDTTKLGIIVRDQYLEISTRLGGSDGGKDDATESEHHHEQQHQQQRSPSSSSHDQEEENKEKTDGTFIFGLGENVGRFRRPAGSVSTMWARDCHCKPEHNLYGCHPFYMEVLPGSGTAHGVLLLSSNGMDVSLSENGDLLTYKVIGGLLEFYFFSGPTPQDVIRQYTALIGRPLLIPYWAMGNHQCRWGYDTLDKVKQVVANFHSHQIPLEAIWIDIDYMDAYKCFTLANKRFPVAELAAFSQQLHSQDQHLVMMLDPGIKLQYQQGLYAPYDDGVAKNLFIKRQVKEAEVKEGKTQQQHRAGDLVDFVGKVWPGLTVFPDWFHPESQEYWTKHISKWVKEVHLDGIWIDMNEIASFHSGDASHLTHVEDRVIELGHLAPSDSEEGSSNGGGEAVPAQPQQHQESPSEENRKKDTSKEQPQPGDQVINAEEIEEATERSERPQEVIVEHEEERESKQDLEHKERRMVSVTVESRQAVPCGVATDLYGQPPATTAKDTRPLVQYADVNRPPYRINNNNEQADLEYRTISADALHYGGVLEYDAHNLFGHMESIATYNSMRQVYPDKKPFVLSRSTFIGTGKYACHWLGDNWSRWYDLRVSIAGFLNFQFFGIPMVGSDVGGFSDIATEELLIRWHQLGSFYPFMRNHNCIGNPSQEPYVAPLLAKVARHHLGLRYRLLPYWYTLFQKAHYEGDLVCAPIWVLAPGDPTLLNIDEQFLVGEAILVSPALYRNQVTVEATFPPGLWYALETGVVEVFVPPPPPSPSSQGTKKTKKHNTATVELKAPLETMPVHVRGGSIVPMCGLPQEVFLATTRQVREAGLELVVALDINGLARGEVIHDDDTYNVEEATRVVMEVATPGVLRIECQPLSVHGQREKKKAKVTVINSIVIWGLGLEQAKLLARQEGGLVGPSLKRSQSKVDIKQVRLSRVEPVAAAELSRQHQRELVAVDPQMMSVLWDSRRARLTVKTRQKEEEEGGKPGGLVLQGGEGLELDWTEALMA
ncbi:hypothetical protein BGW42_000891 [Actinomortierella wolfii]|nr:hypothetical protein BGW42_000891 [Actinomortierella wolfii]